MNPTVQESDQKIRTVKRNVKSREQLEEENQALQYDAEHDWLTGLYIVKPWNGCAMNGCLIKIQEF